MCFLENIDYKDVIDIVNASRRAKVASNFYLSKEQIQWDITNNKLVYFETDGNKYIAEKEDNFYRLYYFFYNTGMIHKLELDMPSVIEYIYKKEILPKDKEVFDFIYKLGFIEGRRSFRTSYSFKTNPESFNIPIIGGIEYSITKAEDIHNAIELLDDTFDKRYAYIPNEIELNRMILDRCSLAAYHNDELIGISNIRIHGKIAEQGQIAMKSKGKGIGVYLLQKQLENMRKRCTLYRGFVDVENSLSIRMHEKLGFVQDGTFSIEFIS